MEFIEVLPLKELPPNSQKTIQLKNIRVGLFHYNNEITAIGNTCLHKGGPLAMGNVRFSDEGCFITCPWHGWEYNIKTGKGPGGFEDQQSVYDVKVEDGKILISEKPVIRARRAEHATDPLADLRDLKYESTADSLNVLGISCTNMNNDLPRISTSDLALENALADAEKNHKAKTKLIRLRELMFRACEGYYSQNERACTWPCSISEMNPDDGMSPVYRALILWADVVLIATPIRWGNASSLYYRMAERLNCVQNQITLSDKVLVKNKVAGFIITGGQDNIQQVAGQMSVFFTELGFVFPPFSFVGWSRGWISEDMEHNISAFQKSKYMKRSVKELVDNCVMLSKQIKRMDTEHMRTPLPKIEEAPSNVFEM